MLTTAQLAEIYDRYRVNGQHWLQLEIGYQGDGEARFSTEPGTVRGPVSARYHEDGTVESFEMIVRELVADRHPELRAPDALFVFLHGHAVPGQPGRFGLGAFSNDCDELIVSGENFVMRVVNPIASASGTKITFRPLRATVHFLSKIKPRYWVAPLLNFVSGFVVAAPDLQGHVLRTRETASYQPGDGEADLYHQLAYQQGNALIPFVCEGELGFIEPLIDYEQRAARVEEGETLVTAVMAGRVPLDWNYSQEEEWFPTDLVTLLGLATGRGVGVPFFELRGRSGELVARMHVTIGSSSTRRRTAVIDESVDRSTGALLSDFLTSKYRGQTWLRVALKHLLSGFTGDMTVEDHMAHLFRAAEGLAAGLGLNKGRALELDTEIRERVTKHLQDLIAQLAELSRETTGPDRKRLQGLKSRISDVAANRPSFQTQLLELVEHARLPDAQWLSEFRFRATIRGQPTRWSSVAGKYRNMIFHSAFIDFERYDLENAVSFIAHLSDVLIRVVFRLIGFKGHYMPPCGAHGMTMHETPEWPKPERLSPRLLRYIE